MKISTWAAVGVMAAIGVGFAAGGSADSPQVPIVIGFDDAAGMTSISRHPVPESAKVSTNYLSHYGISFWSTLPYVAVVNLGKSAISPPNGIGGVAANGNLSYDARNPIYMGFFMPSSGDPAVTDNVTVYCDKDGSGKMVHLVAYDINGAPIAQDDEKDQDGAKLTVHASGIHMAIFYGTTDDDGAALDDVTFDAVTPAGADAPAPR